MTIGLARNNEIVRRLEPYWGFLLRFSIVCAVLLLSAFLARRDSPNDLVLAIGLGAMIVLLRLPPLGLILLLVASLIVPFAVATSSQTPLNISLVLVPVLVAVWLLDMIRKRDLRLTSARVMLPFLALALVATLSFLAGQLPWNLFARTAPLTAQAGGWAVFVFSIAVFILAANQLDNIRWLKVLTYVFFAIGGIYMVDRVASGMFGVVWLMNGMNSDGSLFWTWLVALAFGQLVFNREASRLEQAALAALVILTLAIGWFDARSWVSGWLPPLVAVGSVLLLRSWRLALVLALVAGVYIGATQPDILSRLQGGEAYSSYTRDAARDILLFQVLPLSPVFGLGPANYYWYTPLYPILGWYVSFNSHNNYIDILLQTGILGMACFVWGVAALARFGLRLRKHFDGDFAQGYVNGCLGGLAGTLVAAWLADWLLPFVYNIGLNGFRASILAWLFLGAMVGLGKMAQASSSDKNQFGNGLRGGGL